MSYSRVERLDRYNLCTRDFLKYEPVSRLVAIQHLATAQDESDKKRAFTKNLMLGRVLVRSSAGGPSSGRVRSAKLTSTAGARRSGSVSWQRGASTRYLEELWEDSVALAPSEPRLL